MRHRSVNHRLVNGKEHNADLSVVNLSKCCGGAIESLASMLIAISIRQGSVCGEATTVATGRINSMLRIKLITMRASQGPTLITRWMLPAIGALFLTVAAFSLWGALLYSVIGVRTSGKVIEFHQDQARSVSITGQVEVSMPGFETFRWEVNDPFGRQQWEEGGTVPLLCANVHSDHTTCVIDSLLDRFLFPMIALPIAALALFWWRRRKPGRSSG